MPLASLLLRLLALAMIVGAVAVPAAAQTRMGGVGQAIRVCAAPAKPGQTASDARAGRIALDCRAKQTALGGGDFWVVSQKFRRSGEVALRSASVWQNGRTVYAYYADGKVIAKHSDPRTATRNLQLGAIFFDRLPARPAPLVQIVWKIEGAANLRGIVVDPRLATIRETGWSNLSVAAIFAGFAGLAIALFIHNFALWTAMRHRFQLAYCFLLAMLLTYAFTSSGALAWAFPWFDNNDRLRLNYAGMGLSAVAAIHFARTFFEPEVFGRWLGHMVTAIGGIVLTACLGYALLAPWNIWYLDRAFALSFALLVLFVPVFLYRAWRRGSPFMWAFALAWAVPVLCAALRIANNLNWIGWNFWIDHSTVLSMALEALLSSVGITYRIRLLSRERDEARAQELAARKLADTDPLTGLLNRRAFLARAIGRAGEQSLLVIDIDHFKRVNETIGHDGGDEVLRVFARALRGCAHDGVLVARIGGEEFAVLSDAARPIDPDALLARIRAQRMPFDLAVTASVGMCTGALSTEIDWKNLYRRADRALFQAKADGRDRARGDRSRAA